MYIFAADATGREFRDRLAAAALRGVRVMVLVDAWGSWTTPEAFWAPLRAAGAEVRLFHPIRRGLFPFRNHRKLLLVDDAAAWLGGMNVADEYRDGPRRGAALARLRARGRGAGRRAPAPARSCGCGSAPTGRCCCGRFFRRRTAARGQQPEGAVRFLPAGRAKPRGSPSRRTARSSGRARRGVDLAMGYFFPPGAHPARAAPRGRPRRARAPARDPAHRRPGDALGRARALRAAAARGDRGLRVPARDAARQARRRRRHADRRLGEPRPAGATGSTTSSPPWCATRRSPRRRAASSSPTWRAPSAWSSRRGDDRPALDKAARAPQLLADRARRHLAVPRRAVPHALVGWARPRTDHDRAAARKAVHGPLLRSRSQPPRAPGDPAGLPAGRGGRARLPAAHRGPGPAPPRSDVGPLAPAPDGGALRRGRRDGARAHLALDPGQPLELPRVRGPGPGGGDRRPRHDRLGGARPGPPPPGAAGRRPARLPAGAAPRDRRRFPAAAAPGGAPGGKPALHGAAAATWT